MRNGDGVKFESADIDLWFMSVRLDRRGGCQGRLIVPRMVEATDGTMQPRR